MTKTSHPMAMWALGYTTCKMLFEAQAVITYRMLGLAGIWSVAPRENARMIEEKTKAFSQSMTAATLATMQGQNAGKVLSRALVPIGKTTSANLKRLRKRGLTKP